MQATGPEEGPLLRISWSQFSSWRLRSRREDRESACVPSIINFVRPLSRGDCSRDSDFLPLDRSLRRLAFRAIQPS
jgi:hypothetical protein